MPKALHDKLARQAAAKGYTGERADRYVYGTLNKIEHGKKRTALQHGSKR